MIGGMGLRYSGGRPCRVRRAGRECLRVSARLIGWPGEGRDARRKGPLQRVCYRPRPPPERPLPPCCLELPPGVKVACPAALRSWRFIFSLTSAGALARSSLESVRPEAAAWRAWFWLLSTEARLIGCMARPACDRKRSGAVPRSWLV